MSRITRGESQNRLSCYHLGRIDEVDSRRHDAGPCAFCGPALRRGSRDDERLFRRDARRCAARNGPRCFESLALSERGLRSGDRRLPHVGAGRRVAIRRGPPARDLVGRRALRLDGKPELRGRQPLPRKRRARRAALRLPSRGEARQRLEAPSLDAQRPVGDHGRLQLQRKRQRHRPRPRDARRRASGPRVSDQWHRHLRPDDRALRDGRRQALRRGRPAGRHLQVELQRHHTAERRHARRPLPGPHHRHGLRLLPDEPGQSARRVRPQHRARPRPG